MSDTHLLADGEFTAFDAAQRYLSLQEQQDESAVPPEMLCFVNRLSAELPPSHAPGDHACHPFIVPAEVQPLDANLNPCGTPFRAVTRDLSVTGLGLVYTRAIDDKYLQVTIRTTTGVKSLTVEVAGCRSLGAFYDIGGKFVVE